MYVSLLVVVTHSTAGTSFRTATRFVTLSDGLGLAGQCACRQTTLVPSIVDAGLDNTPMPLRRWFNLHVNGLRNERAWWHKMKPRSFGASPQSPGVDRTHRLPDPVPVLYPSVAAVPGMAWSGTPVHVRSGIARPYGIRRWQPTHCARSGIWCNGWP